ncbi:MAG: sodium:solute symporter family protein, partial [Candidatus Bathyarchaeia archaeon]
LIVTTGAVSRDIYQQILRPKASDSSVLALSRVVAVVIGAVSFIFALMRPALIFTIILFVFGGMGVLVPAIVLGLYWKRATREGALASIIIGEIILIFLTSPPDFAKPTVASILMGGHPLLLSSIIALIVMIVVSYASKPTPKEILDQYFPS